MQWWQVRRGNETEAERCTRLNRTCCHCGTEFPTTLDCDTHEEACPRAPQKGRKPHGKPT